MNTTDNLSQDSQSSGRDANPGPHESDNRLVAASGIVVRFQAKLECVDKF
jgi:hypothetical protein